MSSTLFNVGCDIARNIALKPEIDDVFNDYFTNIGQALASKILKSP